MRRKKIISVLSAFFCFMLLGESGTLRPADAVGAFSRSVYVVPSGELIGVKLYTDGILVVDVTAVVSSDGSEAFPARDAGIKEGDRILCVNSEKIESAEDLSSAFCEGVSASVTVMRGDESFDTVVTPVLCGRDNVFRIGVWARSSTAGIGTLTYYLPSDGSFAALGHSVSDEDTGTVLTVGHGSILDCSLLSITRGKKGSPGEINGSFSQKETGDIEINNYSGIYGHFRDLSALPPGNAVEAADRSEIECGSAYILADIDGSGARGYSIEIKRVNMSSSDNKGIVFKVTDEALLEKTGGIIQGMSGAPIIQNGKFIGAVTHVLINDPAKGYGIFADLMLENNGVFG